ncbi:alpha/beta fold hydrolase [Caulobacter sp.]|uniref:alpha/beta fold hydrolase n=1 Tax=Caulobacter sp. TaxID=78 RepID=UPI001B0EB767|nr:alpha/beta fold hydrolase [Caulobacter sp.]MBO9546484.1 alpha/beta fold hydrolase [Caulobacter sp.]
MTDEPRLPTFLRAVMEDADAVLAATRDAPDALDALIEPEAAQAGFSPLFNPQSIAAAVLDAKGRVRAASRLFAEELGERYIDPGLVARALHSGKPVVAPVAVESGGGPESVIFVYAPAGEAFPAWRLPPELAQEAPTGKVVVLTTLSARAGPIEQACAAFGLTASQTRIVQAVIRAGSIKGASEMLAISHVTGRETLSEIYRRTGTRRVSELVGLLSGLAFGAMPSEADHAPLLVDVWGLSRKQASIALVVAGGASREEAARALGLSVAVVRKEMEQVFATLRVSSASELARTVSTLSALGALLGATRGQLGFADPRVEPLRLLPRADGTRIAWSDYGPVGGRPVLIVHSSMTSRLAPSGLVEALQRGGFRPIAVDRPGFGMTDPVPGLRAGEHDPFDASARDLIALLDALRLPAIDIVARGGAQAVLALARRAPERVGRVVLVNPDPISGADSLRRGPLGAFKEAYWRRPELIGAFARMLAGSLTRERLLGMVRQSMHGSPPDEAAMADPRIAEDYWRSVRMFATGRIAGYVNEQVAIARESPPDPMPGLVRWSVFIGAHDTLHDPDHVDRYWRRVLPDSRFERVADAGRFLAMTHTARVIETLLDYAATKSRVAL